ncbi:MAG: hypothetical protein CMF75_09740, partial [Maricaulis sp.]|nr:hypothetical protein [Maricaulis sp.]
MRPARPTRRKSPTAGPARNSPARRPVKTRDAPEAETLVFPAPVSPVNGEMTQCSRFDHALVSWRLLIAPRTVSIEVFMIRFRHFAHAIAAGFVAGTALTSAAQALQPEAEAISMDLSTGRPMVELMVNEEGPYPFVFDT